MIFLSVIYYFSLTVLHKEKPVFSPQLLQDLQSLTKRAPIQKPKRINKPSGDKGQNSRKKNKKEEVGKTAETLIKQLKQVNVKKKKVPKVFFFFHQ